MSSLGSEVMLPKTACISRCPKTNREDVAATPRNRCTFVLRVLVYRKRKRFLSACERYETSSTNKHDLQLQLSCRLARLAESGQEVCCQLVKARISTEANTIGMVTRRTILAQTIKGITQPHV
jgi:hypothetical protein